jgi:hypothetical protein
MAVVLFGCLAFVEEHAGWFQTCQQKYAIQFFFFFTPLTDFQSLLQVLSNISELELENAQMLRILAFQYEKWSEIDKAIDIYRKVKKMRGEGCVFFFCFSLFD